MEEVFASGGVHGTLHRPAGSEAGAIALTHGASSNSNAPLLVQLARSFAEARYLVLRYDLPYRQKRPKGPPFPAASAADREGVAEAVQVIAGLTKSPVYAGGVSYGGRQTAMAAAERPDMARALLLLSYPLHPPGKSQQQRTGFFPDLRIPALFVQGTADPFASPEELEAAIPLIPARTDRLLVPGAGHDLKKAGERAAEILARLTAL